MKDEHATPGNFVFGQTGRQAASPLLDEIRTIEGLSIMDCQHDLRNCSNKSASSPHANESKVLATAEHNVANHHFFVRNVPIGMLGNAVD